MQVVLVMEYAPNGDLFTKLERAHREQARAASSKCRADPHPPKILPPAEHTPRPPAHSSKRMRRRRSGTLGRARRGGAGGRGRGRVGGERGPG